MENHFISLLWEAISAFCDQTWQLIYAFENFRKNAPTNLLIKISWRILFNGGALNKLPYAWLFIVVDYAWNR